MKGSGGDLRTAKRDGFASLYLDKLRAMKPRLRGASRSAGRRRRSKTRWYADVHALRLQPEPARLLDRHAAAHVRAGQARRSHAPERGHRHRGLGRTQERLTREIYGDDVIYVPWQRPGFDLGLMIEDLIATQPEGARA